MKLTPEQVESFHRDGCLVVDGYLDEHEIDHIRTCYMETVERLARENILENVQSGEDRDDEYMDAKMPDPDMPDPDMLKILPEGATPLLRGRAMGHESS